MRTRLGCLFVSVGLVVVACGSGSDSQFGSSGGSGDESSSGGSGFGPGSSGGTDGGPRPCENLECKQIACPGGGTTSVSGTVFDPAGKLPLYNVLVYVPNAPLSEIPTGASCDKCDSPISGKPIATALTDTKGNFKLENVPVGVEVPLVVQVGKWRRELKLPAVAQCQDTPLAAGLTRLPKNKAEGHIPRIALTTGGADALECLLRKIGIDDSEFTTESGTGRVNFYTGKDGSSKFVGSLNGGATFTSAASWWGDAAKVKGYDVVLHSCEGDETTSNKSTAARQTLLDYLAAGGRVFASHWHHVWLEASPDAAYKAVATWNHQPDLNAYRADIDQSFPKGKAFGEWLVNVDAQTATHPGKIDLVQAQHTIEAVDPAVAQRWIWSASPKKTIQYFTINAPLSAPAADRCGRMVVSDLHVSGGSGDQNGRDFPSGCTTNPLSAQEKALVFMLFDLSACVQDDKTAPTAPPPVVK